MKITVVYDNRCDNTSLKEGWGFSAFVEDGKRKILFDTGGSAEAFFFNVEKLGIDCGEITHLLFSHRHWDHIAGFDEVLQKLPQGAKVFLPRFFFRSLFKRRPAGLEFRSVGSLEKVDEGVYSIALRSGFLLYEQSLVLQGKEGLIIVTGCAHAGIVDIVQAVQRKLPGKIDLVMGGFHLFSASADASAQIVRDLQALGVQRVAPSHCSGDQAIGQFKKAYGDHFIKVGTGSVVKV